MAFPKPTIARIRGFCLGGGLAIAMQADLRIAAFDSQFGIPAARLSIAYGFDGLKKLVQLVGPAHARMILYTANRIDAHEAERIGLINKAVEDEDLNDAVLEIARTIADNAPLSVAASKLTINEVMKDPKRARHGSGAPRRCRCVRQRRLQGGADCVHGEAAAEIPGAVRAGAFPAQAAMATRRNYPNTTPDVYNDVINEMMCHG